MTRIKRTRIVIRKTELVRFGKRIVDETGLEKCPLCHSPLRAAQNRVAPFDVKETLLRVCEGENSEKKDNQENLAQE